MRLISLEIIQRAVTRWESSKAPLEQYSDGSYCQQKVDSQLLGIIYCGENYLIKMTSDLIFLGDSPAFQHQTGCQCVVGNQFMLPVDDDFLEEKCVEATDRVLLELKSSWE